MKVTLLKRRRVDMQPREGAEVVRAMLRDDEPGSKCRVNREGDRVCRVVSESSRGCRFATDEQAFAAVSSRYRGRDESRRTLIHLESRTHTPIQPKKTLLDDDRCVGPVHAKREEVVDDVDGGRDHPVGYEVDMFKKVPDLLKIHAFESEEKRIAAPFRSEAEEPLMDAPVDRSVDVVKVDVKAAEKLLAAQLLSEDCEVVVSIDHDTAQPLVVRSRWRGIVRVIGCVITHVGYVV